MTINQFCDLQEQRIRQRLLAHQPRIIPEPKPVEIEDIYATALWHGTLMGYSHYACRCKDCRNAYLRYKNLQRQQERRRRLAEMRQRFFGDAHHV